MAESIAAEVRAAGAHIAYGPVLDLARDPRWSRVEEGYGEDPYLAGRLGEAFVRGLQGDVFDPAAGKVISTLKHFAAHGAPEGGHNSAPAHVGLRELYEFHLPPFFRAVRAGALSLMSSYNDIDGVPCTGSRLLLTEILRDEWGFEGFVVSDAAAVIGLATSQRVAADAAEAAALALHSGVDLDLWDDAYGAHLSEAVDRGLLAESDIDTAVLRLLRLKFAMGLFENPFVNEAVPAGTLGCPAHRAVARDLARQSLILLENNGVLPLTNVNSLAVIGPNADTAMNQLGDYTAPQRRESVLTVLDGIKQVAGAGLTVRYAKGCKVRSQSRDGFPEAVALAQQSEAVVLVLGGSSSPESNTGFLENGAARIVEVRTDSEFDKESGEGYDRALLDLAGVQVELLQELKSTGTPIVVVLIQGRPLKLQAVAELADAVLLAWYPGAEGGYAVAEALFGILNPGGKLSISIPSHEGQLPVYYNATMPRGNYVDWPAAPHYSFGYGLSYTTFRCEDLRVTPEVISPEGVAQVSVTVTNTGAVAGEEVVQLYVTDDVASAVRPLRALQGFARVRLEPGESREVTFPLDRDALACFDAKMEHRVEPGTFTLHVGGSPTALLTGTLRVRGG